MDLNINGILLAVATFGIVYMFPIIKMRKNKVPITLTSHNMVIAAVTLVAFYFIWTGVLGLIK